MAIKFYPHHFSLTVRNGQISSDFFNTFGFSQLSEYANEELRIVHLVNDGFIVELFEYFDKRDIESMPDNDPHNLGVEHFGFRVDDLVEARRLLSEKGFDVTEPRTAKTEGIEYFFVYDPDGNRFEILTDTRIAGGRNG